jgi:mono/diheme cytochrome c family protein
MMKKILSTTAAAMLVCGLNVNGAEDVDISKLPASSDKKVDFVKDIKPIFEKSCFNCHGVKPRAKGKYFMNTREKSIAGGSSDEKAIIVGKSAKSPLVHMIADLVEELEMPPLDKREKYKALTKKQIGLVRAWIDQGAKWPKEIELEKAPE